MMKQKRLHVGVKDAEKGQVEAIFSTFNVRDLDGDVTLPGAFEDGAAVRISAYGHTSWRGELPVGKGTIKVTEDDARLVGQFFMNTDHGRDTFETIKGLGELGEWSYGFDIIESETGEFEGEDVLFLKKMKVHEVSPVLLGAGIDTRTVAAKSGQIVIAFPGVDLTNPEEIKRIEARADALRGRRVTGSDTEKDAADVELRAAMASTFLQFMRTNDRLRSL